MQNICSILQMQQQGLGKPETPYRLGIVPTVSCSASAVTLGKVANPLPGAWGASEE